MWIRGCKLRTRAARYLAIKSLFLLYKNARRSLFQKEKESDQLLNTRRDARNLQVHSFHGVNYLLLTNRSPGVEMNLLNAA